MKIKLLLPLYSKYKDFIIFCIIGVGTGVIYFLSISLLYEVFSLDYRVSVSLSYALAIICHFFANKHLAFKNKDTRIELQIVKYAIMMGLNYVTTMAVIIASVRLMSLSVYSGAVLAILMNLLMNFLILKYWIFFAKKNTALASTASKHSKMP